MRWERFPTQHVHQQGAGQQESTGPVKRWGHTCNSIGGGRFLYVFGGYSEANCQTNRVHVFDTSTQAWSHPVINGIPPAPRDSHSCTTVRDNLFVFGGTDGLNPLCDLHILDTSSHTWTSPSVRGDGPEAREGHGAALVGKRLFIFGGFGKSADHEDKYYNDVYILNTETFVWKLATTSGSPPSARDSHTCSCWRNNVIVIGGEDGHDYYLSDVHILDTETLVWREMNTTGMKLPPRAGHATVCFGKNLFVFGGFTDAQNLYDDLYMLDVDAGVWTKVKAAGNGPSARFSVAGDCLDPLKSGMLVFIGGCNRNLEALDDMYYLDTGSDKLQSKQPQFYPQKKLFQAKVTECFSHGYTIKTIIDGRSLHGIVFLDNVCSSILTSESNCRRRAGAEMATLNNDPMQLDSIYEEAPSQELKEEVTPGSGILPPSSKIGTAVDMQVDRIQEQNSLDFKIEAPSQSLDKDVVNHIQTVKFNEKPRSDELQVGSCAASHLVHAIQEPSSTPLNLNRDEMADVPDYQDQVLGGESALTKGSPTRSPCQGGHLPDGEDGQG